MRAATWATNRDIDAARLGLERARTIADMLAAEDPNRLAMRIAPRTLLCAIAFRFHVNVSGEIFDELRELCTAAGDTPSLVLAMAGLVVDHTYHARTREASRLASEAWALAESVGDPSLTVGLSTAAILAKAENSEWSAALRWSQQAIDLADGDPAMGNLMVGSPLALAFAQRATARFWLGLPGWRDDQRHGLTMARTSDALSFAAAVSYVYTAGILGGALRADDRAVREIEEALRIAERSGDDLALALAWMTLGFALVHRPTDAERDRGHEFLAEACDWISRWRYLLCELPAVNAYLARERARCGDRDQAVPVMKVGYRRRPCGTMGHLAPSGPRRRSAGGKRHADTSIRAHEHGGRLRAPRPLAARRVRGNPPGGDGRRGAAGARARALRGRSRAPPTA